MQSKIYKRGGKIVGRILIDSHYNPLIIDDFAPGRADVFRSQYDRLKKKIVSYENDIRDNTDKVKEISDAFAKTQQENDKILYSWRVRLEESETELHAAQEREAEAVQRCVRLESENVRLKGEVQALIEESRKYKEQYEHRSLYYVFYHMSILFMYMQLVFSSLRLHFYNIRIIYSIFLQ